MRLTTTTALIALLLTLASQPARFAQSPAVSVEPGCPGGNQQRPDVVMCDDFEERSLWSIGSNKGTWPTSEFVRCGDAFGFRDRCAAWSNDLLFDGSWGYWGYDATRRFRPQSEFYVRWYQYISDPYTWGTFEDKSLMLHDPPGTITAYIASSRDQRASAPTSGPGKPFLANYQDVDWAEANGQYTRVNRFQNQGQDITLQPGKWYLFEWYIKLGTPGVSDGVTKLWIDDASQAIETQTLRMHYDDMRWLRATDAGKELSVIRPTVYHQRCDGTPNTCPPNGPVILNQSHRWDRIVISTRPIGPLSPAATDAIEAGCPGSARPSAEVALCDDFEPRTFWYGGSNRDTWPASQFVLCGNGFGFLDRCAAWSNELVFDRSWGFYGYDRWTPFVPQSEFYIRWYQYISNPYTWGSLEDTSVILHDPDATMTAYVASSRNQLPSIVNSGPGKPFVANYQDLDWSETGGLYTARNRFQNQAQDIILEPGKWYLFEWYIKFNTPGVSDGVMRLWIDDASRSIVGQTLRMEYSDMRWLRSGDAGKRFGFLRLTLYDQYCGGDPTTCPPNGPGILSQSHRWDHFVISRSRIGPLGLP
jgi:hypothetical protein